MATESRSQAYTLVVGLGMTGLSVVRYLLSRGEYIVVADSRDIPPMRGEFKQHYPDIPLHTGAFEPALFTGAARIIISPGVPLDEPAVLAARENGIDIIGDIDLFAHVVDKPVIAITGSNGKSTVTALLTDMLNAGGMHAEMGGNIGTPVLELLDKPADIYVLELSSFQLDTLDALPMLAATVLNVSEDHMDRYASFESYASSKLGIYDNARFAVINRDDQVARAHPGKAVGALEFTLSEPMPGQYGIRQIGEAQCLCQGDDVLVAMDDLHIRGEHNAANALAAMALFDTAASVAQLDRAAAIAAMCAFKGLSHRTQWVASIDGCEWFDDSKATNVGAAVAAVTGLPGMKVLIAGGTGKDADFSGLAEIAPAHFRGVVLIGRDAPLIEAVLGDLVPVKHATSMCDAVNVAAALAETGDSVLLSPACASFDMFDSYAHRGDEFIRCVQELSS